MRRLNLWRKLVADLNLTDQQVIDVRQFAVNSAMAAVNRLGDVVGQDSVIAFATAIETYIVRPVPDPAS
jgi:hypothetical protein